jgi:hypothetical protein
MIPCGHSACPCIKTQECNLHMFRRMFSCAFDSTPEICRGQGLGFRGVACMRAQHMHDTPLVMHCTALAADLQQTQA